MTLTTELHLSGVVVADSISKIGQYTPLLTGVEIAKLLGTMLLTSRVCTHRKGPILFAQACRGLVSLGCRFCSSACDRKGYPISLYLDAVERRYIEEFNTSNFVAITKDAVKFMSLWRHFRRPVFTRTGSTSLQTLPGAS